MVERQRGTTRWAMNERDALLHSHSLSLSFAVSYAKYAQQLIIDVLPWPARSRDGAHQGTPDASRAIISVAIRRLSPARWLTLLTLVLRQSFQRLFQQRQSAGQLVHTVGSADLLWSRALPAGLAFAASVELVLGLRDLYSGKGKKEGW